MKTFIYTCSEKWDGCCTQKTVVLYRIIKNKPVLVGQQTSAYIDEFELVFRVLDTYDQLPVAAYLPDKVGRMKYFSAWGMKEAGIADIIRI